MTNNFLNQNIAQAAHLLEKGNIERALGIFKVLCSKYPNNSQVFHLKAYAHMQSNDINLSINSFEKALAISPYNCDITLDYCNLLNTIGKNNNALDKLETLVKIKKEDYRIFFLKGCIEMNLQFYDKAILSFKKVLELNYNHKDASFNLGVIYFETNNFKIAEEVFTTHIKTFGNDFEAEKYLFQIYFLDNKLEKANELSLKLCHKCPNDSILWYERARLLTLLNNNRSAIDCYKKCLEISPNFNDGFKNMALLLKKEKLLEKHIEHLKNKKDNKINEYTKLTNIAQGLFVLGNADEALIYIEKALTIHPKKNTSDKDYLNTVIIKGNIYSALEEHDKAIETYNQVLEIDKNIFQAYSNIGDSLVKLKKEKEAIKFFEKSLSIKSNYSTTYLNMGNAYFKLGEKEKALEYFEMADKLEPQNSNILSSKGAAHIELDEPRKALDYLQRAIKINPLNGNAYLNLGIIFKNQNLFDKAIKMFNACISACSNSGYQNKLIASAYSNIGLCYLSLNMYDKLQENFLIASQFDENRELVDGFIYYSKLYCADWKELEKYKNITLNKVARGLRSSTPFCSFSLTDDPEIQLKIAKMCTNADKNDNTVEYNKEKYFHHAKHTKPKVAYISYDFHDHATMHLMAGVFENQNHNKFDYYAFSYSDKVCEGSEVCERVKKSFNNFFMVNEKSDKEICQLLKDNEIDIAVDLKGHTYKTRIGILSSRPSPIQVTFLGHPGTTAADYIDYVIGDKFVINQINEKYFTEKALKLNHCYQPNDNKRYLPKKVFTKRDLGLPEDNFVFCSFNSPYKIQPVMFRVWMEILQENKNSVLWLLENENAEATKNIIKHANGYGIDKKRIFFLKRCNMNEYLEKMQCADLFLDTFPITAHTTASDALWVGTPIITYAGKSMVSRVAGSILQSIGMQELITYDYSHYKELALKISRDKNYHDEIKNKINENRFNSNLFNTKKYTKELENIYLKLFNNFKKSLGAK